MANKRSSLEEARKQPARGQAGPSRPQPSLAQVMEGLRIQREGRGHATGSRGPRHGQEEEDDDGENDSSDFYITSSSEDDKLKARRDAIQRLKEQGYETLHLTSSTEAMRMKKPYAFPEPGDSARVIANKERNRSFYSDRDRRERDKAKAAAVTLDNAEATINRRAHGVVERDFAYPAAHDLHGDSRRKKDRPR